MLKNLKIKNLALVDEVQVEFRRGLNVITGETGAGKSLLIGALRLLLGDRADKSMIRTGESSCSVYATFELQDASAVNAVLEEIGMDPCENGVLVIRRVISEASNKTLVNHEPVTLQVIRKLGNVLVDMHGPYDHQSLLNTSTQLEILDSFGQTQREREAYSEAYRLYRSLQKELEALNGEHEEGIAQQIDFLSYRVAEIDEAKLSVDEEREITEEHSTIANMQQIIELANGAMGALTEGEGCAFESLAAAQRCLASLGRLLPNAQEWVEEIESAIVQVQEVGRSIAYYAEGIDVSPERMLWLDDRITTYQSLKRKYGPTVEEVLSHCETWKEELTGLRGRDEKRLVLETKLQNQLRLVEQAAMGLREKRSQVAKQLSDAISVELRDIGFEHGLFDVALADCEPGPSGMDEVEFGFAPNAGETMRPLRQIASSGEISRVMLATKAILARYDRIPLLVFDEVDANVGGEIGGAVGRKLAQVAESHQLICITHLPQVAACGHTHFAVSKSVQEGRTFTRVVTLEDQDRAEEIARMLGGKAMTSLTLEHAREMLGQQTLAL
jgi:DNA repair protein RecN (Recombination protein N)